MNSRAQLTVLLEKLAHFPNKTRTHLIEGAREILKILANNPEGNTFLRQEDKRYLDILDFYLKPVAKMLNIGSQIRTITSTHLDAEVREIEYAYVTNIKPINFQQLNNLLQTEQLVEEVTRRVGNSYQRIIIGLQLENQRLTNLLNQPQSAVNDRPHPIETETTAPETPQTRINNEQKSIDASIKNDIRNYEEDNSSDESDEEPDQSRPKSR